MKQRFWLFRRGNVFYLEDTLTGEQKSLGTSDKKEAERLRAAKNEAVARPMLGLALGKAYLAAYDPKLVERSWTEVMEAFCAKGKPSTRLRRQRGMRARAFDLIRAKKLIETTADNFQSVLNSGGVFLNCDLKCLHNLAIGMGWLPWPIIPTKLWPQPTRKPKRAITVDEHERIIGAEHNLERRQYYELLWEIGASQSDAANLTAESISWTNKTLAYQRMKTGTWCHLEIGTSLESLLHTLPVRGPLFPRIGQTSDRDRAAEFRRRCRLLKIAGVSLHSYRYSWAERAKQCGYPQNRRRSDGADHLDSLWKRPGMEDAAVCCRPRHDRQGVHRDHRLHQVEMPGRG
jgi:integrase